MKLSRYAIVLLVTLLVYSALVAYAISVPRSDRPRYWLPDSGWYVRLAENLIDYGHFSRQTSEPFLWEPYRTPGYPVLVAAGMRLTGCNWGALCFVPLFAVLLVWSLMGLTRELWRDERVITLAGWFGAFLPAGLGWAGCLLTDYVHASLVVFALYMTVLAIREDRWFCALLAALAWSGCQWLRPVSLFVPVFILLISLWQARRQAQYVLAAVLIVASLLTPLYLSCRVFRDHGIMTVSLLGRGVLRYYILGYAEARGTGEPFASVVARNRALDFHASTGLDPRTVYTPQKPCVTEDDVFRTAALKGLAHRLYQVQGERNREVLRKYPVAVATSYLREVLREFICPWYSLPAFFVTDVSLPLRGLMCLAYWAFLILAAAGSVQAVRQGQTGAVVVVWLIVLYWVLTSGISPGQVGRLRLPGDFLLVPLAAHSWAMAWQRKEANPC